ncbi:MAG: DUF192 domain-containing protein [Candidatus Staskawiczbacteria bacterium]|jgi:hypothetical protein
MKIIYWIILILAIAIILIGYFLFPPKTKTQVCFDNNCFNVETADNVAKQKNGLMLREELKNDQGMLFIFSKEDIYPFWMKNTLIPLDIIWLNENKEVVFINENTQPCLISPCPDIVPTEKAKYVLEINAGLVNETGLSVGSKLDFK